MRPELSRERVKSSPSRPRPRPPPQVPALGIGGVCAECWQGLCCTLLGLLLGLSFVIVVRDFLSDFGTLED